MRSMFSISVPQTFLLRKLGTLLLFIAWLTLPVDEAAAQCPPTTYTVGTGVGIPNLTSFNNYTLSYTEIKVKGTFTVDNAQTWQLDAVTLYMDAGASILIEGGGTFIATNSTITNCGNFKWGQILAANASIIADNCEVAGSQQVAFHVVGTSPNFSITNNRFHDNNIGVRMTGSQLPTQHNISGNTFVNQGVAIILVDASNVTIGYNTYVRDFGKMTGIDILGTTSGQSANITVNGGQMRDLTLGVTISQSRLITLRNVIFYGERGIFADKCRDRLNMIQCSVRAVQQAIEVTNHTTNDALNTPTATNGNIFIDRTTATSQLNTAVRVFNTAGKGTIEINKNFVIPSFDHPTAINYYGIEVGMVSEAKLRIVGNTVSHTPFQGGPIPGGIYVYRSNSRSVVRNNKVNANQYGDYRFGIGIFESPNLEVVGNEIDGGPKVADRALTIEEAGDNILLCCNTLDRAVRGLNMVGGQENCKVFTTKYKTLGTALYYDHVLSSNAPQYHRGNDWSTANTTLDGFFDGSGLAAQSAFYTVDPGYLPSGLSKIVVSGGNASDWFADLIGSEALCVNTDASFCGETPRPEPSEITEGLNGNDEWAAQPLPEAAAGYAAAHWYAQRRLYDKLVRNPALQHASAAISTFFAAAQSGNLGKLRAVEQGLTLLSEPPAAIASAYQALQNTVSGLYAAIAALDEHTAEASASELPALLAQRADLAAQADIAQHQIAAYEPDIVAERARHLQDLQVLNASVTPITSFESNEKNINALWLSALEQGNWVFNEAQKSMIDGIAARCSSVGGPAVYQARLLQEYYRMPDWNMDDCGSTDQRSRTDRPTSKDVLVFPNPANDLLRIEFSAAPTDCRVELLALTGQIMTEARGPAGTTLFEMPISQVPNGCYLLRVLSAGQVLHQQKVAVAR